MSIKALLHEYYTKRCIYGNVYHAVKVTNPKTGASFITETPSLGNVRHILNDIFGRPTEYYETESCTGSARLSSLPTMIYLNNCHESKEWRKALRGIGYRLPKTVKG